jgi:type IV secretory pathway TrbF-like protein
MGLAIFTANHKTGKQTSGASEAPGTYNSYLAARREWDERYGDQMARARNWRTIAVLCTMVALVATSGVVWLSVRSRIVPFVVVTDNLGRPVASGLRDLYGAVKEKDRWKGAFSIALNPPKDERLARINPLGVYVTQTSWSRVL